MHELSIVEGLLQTVASAAQKANARSITAIDLTIGDLTGVVDDSVRFYFDLLSSDTLAAGAELRIQREYATGRCACCGYTGAITPPIVVTCPACSSEHWQISGGRDLSVASIDIEPADAGANDPIG
jgi:hydrogenase nickel incorporation protein HypA/HybF